MLKSEKGVIDAPVDLNAASEADLASIDGIGPARARAIAAWRREHGRFEAVEDLRNVGDFGVDGVRKVRDRLKV